jgi:3-hydroxypropanoate dehydrogenase
MSLALDPAAQDLLFREAHTAQKFSPEPVTEEQLKAVHDLVKFGPTAFNQSPLRVTLVQSPEARARLVELLMDGNKAKTASAPVVAILSADAEFHEELDVLLPAIPNAKDMFFSERTVRERSALANAQLQAAYFIIGARAAGLAAGPMTGADMEGIRKEFLGDDHLPLMVVNIGHPSAEEGAHYPRAPRLSYEQVFTTV